MEQVQHIEQCIITGDLQRLEEMVNVLEQSTDFEQIYESAAILMEAGLVPQADRLYAMLLIHLPNAAQLKIDRAEALMALGKEDEALLLLTDIQPNEEEYLQALLVLADYYQTIGLAETALSKIEEAATLSPEEPVIVFAKAELLLNSGRYAEASRLYVLLYERGITEIAGQSLESRIAEVYSAGAAYEDALPYYNLLIQKGNVLPDTLFGAAYCEYQLGQPKEALRHLEQLIEMDPDFFSAYRLAGQANLMLEENEQALTFFEKGIQRDEYDKELRVAAGKAALKVGRPSESETHFEEALALDPEYVEARLSLASLYEQQGRFEELYDLLQSTPEEQLDIPLFTAFLAYAQEYAEQFAKAYESYARAYTGMKEDPDFLERYAKFLLEEGKRSEAIQIVRQIVALVPDHPEWRSFLENQEEEEA